MCQGSNCELSDLYGISCHDLRTVERVLQTINLLIILPLFGVKESPCLMQTLIFFAF